MRLLAITLATCLIVTACEPILIGGTSLGIQHLKIFQNPDVNLKAKNYAAADYLIGQARTFIKTNDAIKVNPLVNLEDPETPADIGRMIPEQIGERWVQLGYRVNDNAVATLDKANPKTQFTPDYVLNGYYQTNHPNLEISLRLTNVKTGRNVGVFDYIMPTNREIRELSTPKAQIIRIEK